jgi:hypothetical protein
MWILLIMSTVIELEEPKITYWDSYITQTECLLERAVLTSTFTQGERALCIKKEK